MKNPNLNVYSQIQVTIFGLFFFLDSFFSIPAEYRNVNLVLTMDVTSTNCLKGIFLTANGTDTY